MMTWDMWKKSFDVWENETAKFLEVVMKSPVMLGPSGKRCEQIERLAVRLQQAQRVPSGTHDEVRPAIEHRP